MLNFARVFTAFFVITSMVRFLNCIARRYKWVAVLAGAAMLATPASIARADLLSALTGRTLECDYISPDRRFTPGYGRNTYVFTKNSVLLWIDKANSAHDGPSASLKPPALATRADDEFSVNIKNVAAQVVRLGFSRSGKFIAVTGSTGATGQKELCAIKGGAETVLTLQEGEVRARACGSDPSSKCEKALARFCGLSPTDACRDKNQNMLDRVNRSK